MIERNLKDELFQLLKDYPVVTITGPRQAGKTTLARHYFPAYNYCNLEQPEIRKLALDDPKALFHQYSPPVIIDEIQRVPALLSYIQVMVDEVEKKGMFILTGSHQMALQQAITQSLAGRTALLTLLPLSLRELAASEITLSWEEHFFRGFLPRIYKDNLDPFKAYRNYFQTYIERDLRQISQIKDLVPFENFMRILAGRVGQLINLNSIANDLGLSGTTLSGWLSVLEASYIIFRLAPYYENFGKRIIKTPKLYFHDTGLICYLLGIESPAQVLRDPLRGNLFENMVILESLKSRLNQGADSNLYFFRDNNGKEVDLLFKQGRDLIPIEIKSAMTFHPDHYKGIFYFQRISRIDRKGFLVYAGNLTPESEACTTLNFRDTYRIFQ